MDSFSRAPVSSKLSPFIDRYVKNADMDTHSLSKKSLLPLSPSKMNLSYSPPVTPTKEKILHLTSPLKFNSYEDKENSTSLSRSPVLKNLHQSSLSPTDAGTLRKTVSALATIDISNLSNTELKYYEFLCRVAEEKRWIENLIGETLPSEIELCTGDILRDGVYLAQVTQIINPNLAPSIFPAGRKLQFKHTQNINAFLSLVDHVGVPESFRFELQDLYNKKDIPQVVETLHILIIMINRKWPGKTAEIENLSGKVGFTKEELRRCQREWPRIRDFKSLAAAQLSPSNRNSKMLSSPGLIQDFSKFDERPGDLALSPPVTPTKPRTRLTHISSNVDENLVNMASYEIKKPTDTISEQIHVERHYTPTFKSSDLETPRLQYSPIKNMSLSYYSPTISKYLTYDSDFYLRRSQNRTSDLQYYDNYGYDRPQYSPTRKQKMTEHEFLDKVIQIQSQCKAVNLRFSLFMQKRLLGLFEKDIVGFQAHIRGVKLRTYLHITNRKKVQPDVENNVSWLQAILRGNKIRYSCDSIRMRCIRQEHTISKLQFILKAILIRNTIKRQLYDRSILFSPVITMQAYVRGTLKRKSMISRFMSEEKNNNNISIIQLQAFSRGKLIRDEQSVSLDNLEKTKLNTLQSILRGKIQRTQLEHINQFSSSKEQTFKQLAAVIRGYHTRESLHLLHSRGQSETCEVTNIQGIVRGILVRYTLDLVDEIIEDSNICRFQAMIRGSMIRLNLRKRDSYYFRNERSINMIQNKIRMYQQRLAYLEIMDYPNPSLWAVKKFSYLLNGSGTIEDAQNSLETCQASLDAENLRKNNTQRLLREQIEMVGILEMYGLGESLSNMNIPNNLDISSSKFTNFENLFYLLQVNPSYWKIMYKQNPEFVESNVYLTFTTLNKKMGEREKVYYVRHLAEILQYSMSKFKNITDFLTSHNQSWEKQVRTFLQREYANSFSLFLPLIEFLDNPRTSFESNPYHIYEALYRHGVPSGVSPIDDPEVKRVFIENLKEIWHSIELVADIYSRLFEKIPIEVRFLCTKIFGFAADKNADEVDSIRSISKVLIDCFITEYLENVHYYGFVVHNSEATQRKVEVVLSTVRTVFEMRKFSGYLDPLNQYSDEINPHIRNILYNIMIEPDYEQTGDRMIYTDMVAKPVHLEMLSEKAKEIYDKFVECSSLFPDNDIIQDVLKEETTWKEFPKSGRIYLQLNASVYRFLASDDQMRKLYDQVKRAIIYMTQIEEVNTTLYDLVVSNVLPEDEPLFQQFLTANKIIRKDPLLKHLEPCTYFKLKNVTLKKIHDLEGAGLLSTTDNKLQNLLNDIANTIKNPNYAIDYVRQELKTTRMTLEKLSKLNQEDDQKLKLLKRAVHDIIHNSQKSHNFSPAQKGTFGNIKSAYKNLQHKSHTELGGLKFKWTTRQLYEKGVVVSIQREKLGEQTIKVFGSSGPKYPDIVFKISTSDGSRYGIQMIDKRKGTDNLHSEVVDSFTFTSLLNTQTGEKVKKWTILNSKVTLDTSKLLKLVVDTFLS